MEAAGTSRGVGASQVRSRGHPTSHLLHTEGEQGSRKTRWETKPVLASSGLADSPRTRGEAACPPTCWKRSELAIWLPCVVFPGREKGGDAITPLLATTSATPAPPQPALDTAAWYRDLFHIKAVWRPPSPQPRERLLRGQSGTTLGMHPGLGPAVQSSGAPPRDSCEQDAESRPLGSVLPGQERG